MNRKVLLGTIAFSVLIVSFILITQTSTASLQAAAPQACYFPSVFDDDSSTKAWIEIMNIAPVGKEKGKVHCILLSSS